MWFLTNIKSNKRFYLLHDQPRYQVSRNGDTGDLTLAGDNSISRTHASLQPDRDHVKITDTGSKYGTFVNGNIDTDVPMEKHVSQKLNLNDRIRFGRLENIWRLDKLEVSSLSSMLTLNEKKTLKKDMDTINGTLLSEWSDKCTHLTVCTITITPKVLQALSGTVPVVTPDFWTSFIAAAHAGSDLPNTSDFVPPIAEPFLSGNFRFTVNVERRRLFVKHEFVFMLTKHMERFESIIRMSGGRCCSMDKKRVQKSSLIKPGVCVVHYNPSTQSQTSQDIATICEHLRSKGHRTIPDCEIGLALLHCSTVKFCNPLFCPDDDFQMPSIQRAPSVVLAGETPPVSACSAVNINVEIPETLTGKSESYEPIVLIDDDSISESMPNSVNVPVALLQTRGCAKRRASKHLDESAAKRRASVEDFGEISRQLLDDDMDLLDSISFDEKELSISVDIAAIGQPKKISFDEKEALSVSVDIAATGQPKNTIRPPLKPVNTPTPNSQPLSHSLEKSIQDSSQLSTGSICSSGFISKQKTLPRVQAALPSVVQPIQTTHNQTAKRAFNLLSNDSDSDDNEDDASGALFKFDKNPVRIKRVRPTTHSTAVQSKSNDNTDSELFAFSSTASSQKLATQQPSAKANNRQSNQSNGRLGKTIMSNMLNMSIQPIQITRIGWMSGKAVKKEDHPIADVDQAILSTKSEMDEDVCDSKAWIEQIKNPFVVRIKKMNLVNRSTSIVAFDNNATVSGKNFKAFVKKHNFKAQTTVLKTAPIAPSTSNVLSF